VSDEPQLDDLWRLRPSFGWTWSRATRMYFVWHAPFDEMLEHFGLEAPSAFVPPAWCDEMSSDA
jgi:hypothetical protein